MPTTLLNTVHGSRLYGLSRSDSDHDTYRVVLEPGHTSQRVSGHDDTTVVSLNDYVRQVSVGVPQALEALWSPYAHVREEWKPYFASLRPGYWATLIRYDRTIKNFRSDPRGHSVKRSKHAMRLALNRAEFERTGRFNPVLTPDQITLLRWVWPH